MDELRHGLSFDVECHYQIVWKDCLQLARAPTIEVERNTDYLLGLLDEHHTRATFFTLGNVAERYPGLVRRIVDQGHELGVHGHDHHYIHRMTPRAFREEIGRAVGALESVSGAKVLGHRAPAFSIGAGNMWALDVLRDAGLSYDSSIFPIQGRRYGVRDAPKTIHKLDNGLFEVPLTALEVGSKRLPAAGGGYFRLFPFRYTHWALSRCAKEGRPAITYFHPHEFEMTRAKVGAEGWKTDLAGALRMSRINALQSLGRGRPMRRKLALMLARHRFSPIGELLPTEGQFV